MKSNYTIFVIELFILILGITIMALFPLEFSNANMNTYFNFSQKIADLNLALVITAIISFTTENKIQIKQRHLKKIVRESWILILLNSLAIIISDFFGIYGIFIVMAGFFGNLIKIKDLCKYILCII